MSTIRSWHCRNCGRTNQTEIAQDGHVKCESCHWVMRIQPSRERGGETHGQLYRRPLPTRA
jgi:DNA-directed RNA polymerase subunit RPC12/RpoP